MFLSKNVNFVNIVILELRLEFKADSCYNIYSKTLNIKGNMHIERLDSSNSPPVVASSQARKEKGVQYWYPVRVLRSIPTTAGKAVRHVIKVIHEAFTRVQRVFFQIIYRPPFDPRSVAFKQKIESHEKHAVALKQQILALDKKFLHKHLFSQDLKELNKIQYEIRETIDELQACLVVIEKCKASPKIHQQVSLVRDEYQKRNAELETYCSHHTLSIMKQLRQILRIFTADKFALPQDIYHELMEDWKELVVLMNPYLAKLDPTDTTGKTEEFKDTIQDLRVRIRQLKKERKVSQTQKIASEPMKLRNTDNSCYMHSVLQALLANDEICEQLKEPIEPDYTDVNRNLKRLNEEKIKLSPAEYERKMGFIAQDMQLKQEECKHRQKIQQALLEFVHEKQHPAASKVSNSKDLALFLLEGQKNTLSFHRLRDAIVDSNFSPGVFNSASRTEQKDAGEVVNLVINHFLPLCKYKRHYTQYTDELPGLLFPAAVEDESCVELNIEKGATHKTLEELVQDNLGKCILSEKPEKGEQELQGAWTPDPKDGIVIQGKEAEATLSRAKPVSKVQKLQKWFTFDEMSNVVVLHCNRFIYEEVKGSPEPKQRKINVPISLGNGVIDLTKYYDAPEGAEKAARYKVKSYIVHIGSKIEGGHFTSYVELNGKYHACDDLGANNKEISQDEFLAQKDAYVIVLERIE